MDGCYQQAWLLPGSVHNIGNSGKLCPSNQLVLLLLLHKLSFRSPGSVEVPWSNYVRHLSPSFLPRQLVIGCSVRCRLLLATVIISCGRFEVFDSMPPFV